MFAKEQQQQQQQQLVVSARDACWWLGEARG
jgi:hypothetical protein